MKPLVFLVILVAVLFATCPSAEMHRKALLSELRTGLSQSDDIGLLFAGALLGDDEESWDIAMRLAGVRLEVRNYLVVSCGYLHSREGTKWVSIGAFSHVCLPSKDGNDLRLH